MKQLQTLSFLFLNTLFLTSFIADNPDFSIGDTAPLSDLKMTDVASGDEVSLSELNKENGLLVIFSCNTCPFVLAWEDQFPPLGELTASKNIGMVLVNSNEAKRSDEDSKEAMKKHYKDADYNTPYLVDKGSKLADAFEAKTTPHVYLFNNKMELVYRGSINDKFEDREKIAKTFFLEEAIKNLSSKEAIDPADTREIGCSIKRVKA